jgi:hypothetical protein
LKVIGETDGTQEQHDIPAENIIIEALQRRITRDITAVEPVTAKAVSLEKVQGEEKGDRQEASSSARYGCSSAEA